MSGNPKYQYADMDKLRETQKEALEDFADRVSNFAQGTVKEYAAPFANTAGTLLAGSGAAKETVKLLPINSSGKYKGVDRQALHDMQIQQATDYAQALQETADRWKQSGVENMTRSKQGLTPLEQGFVDASTHLAKLLGDRALGAATGIGETPYLAIRTFGDAAQTARQEGATTRQEILYGLGSAASGALIEKAVNGIGNIYGDGGLDPFISDAVDKIVEKRGLSEWQRVHLKNALTALIEGVESGVGNMANQALKSTYNDKTTLANMFTTEWDDIGRDVLNSFIAALLLKEK